MVGSPSHQVLKRTTVIWVGSVSGFVPVAMAPPSPVRLNAESITDSVPILQKTPLRHPGGEQPSSPSAIAYGRKQGNRQPCETSDFHCDRKLNNPKQQAPLVSAFVSGAL